MLFGDDEVSAEIERVLHALTGEAPLPDALERKHIDLKEEAGRRDTRGLPTPGHPRNEEAARALARESACMANTDGGGALVIGVSDDGQLIGAVLDAEWLRGRIYDLTQRQLTVDVREVDVRGTRLLIIRSPQAIEPIRMNQKISWRVDDRCVEVDASTWHARHMSRMRYDWSSLDSTVGVEAVRTGAVERAREFLLRSGEAPAADLARATTPQLLRRLNVVSPDGYLTNAGVIAFVGRGEPCIDYIRRNTRGGDSVLRLRHAERSLLEELAEVETSINGFNATRHVGSGLVRGQFRDLPPLSVREAIVNGVVHRDWAVATPTLVEHVGMSLSVVSPGGFVGGVTPENIITHPSQPRNRALAELFASLRVAEREGIGVDRMVRDMVRLGHAAPEIAEVSGPYVRAALVGEGVDEGWVTFLSLFDDPEVREDLNTLLLLSALREHQWIDVDTASRRLQLLPGETHGAINRLATITLDGENVIEPVLGIPTGHAPAWKLSNAATRHLVQAYAESARVTPVPPREIVALSWARARGRVSTTELASIVNAYPSNVGSVLKSLEDRGELVPSRENRRGAGFYYRPVDE